MRIVDGSILVTSSSALPTIVIGSTPFAPRLNGLGQDPALMSTEKTSFTTWIVWSQVAVFPQESVAVQWRTIVRSKRCASQGGTVNESVYVSVAGIDGSHSPLVVGTPVSFGSADSW